jgi:hypothetical protein
VYSVSPCFQRSVQWMARGLMLFFETQRHGGTERKGGEGRVGVWESYFES